MKQNSAQSTNSTSGLSRRIVGGGAVETYGFDFIIYFVPKNPAEGVKGCTGVLIAPKFVLTTQACVGGNEGSEEKGGKLVLAIGATDKKTKKKSFTNFTVVKTYQNTNFPPVGYYNHIALMELDKEVPETVAQPIKIFASDYTNDIPAILVGYAAESTPTSAISLTDMRQTTVSLDSPDYCQDALDNINGKTELCSRTTAGLNTCGVDYGTPLLTKYEIPSFGGSTGKGDSSDATGYALLGLTTYAYHNPSALMKCVYGSKIGFYTWLYPFIDEISSATGLNEEQLVVGNLTSTQHDETTSSSSSSSTTSKTRTSKTTSSSDSSSSKDDDEEEQQQQDEEEGGEDTGANYSGPITQMVFTPKPAKGAAAKAYNVYDSAAVAMLSSAVFAALASFF
ncbi:hypothetical protein LPJ75_000312 [Coemansia sp. RSA 2598]|nr:hypothetical protein LPJ75_000312 [Coemansia sp. RSA 2598]